MKSYILEKISNLDENLVKHPGVNMNNVFISIDKTLDDNVFQIHVGPRFIFIRAANEAMLFYGTLDFLQETSTREILISRTQSFDQAQVLVELGQEFHSQKDFKNLIRVMALNKMNLLKIQISGNSSYGLESRKFPHLNSDLCLSVKEVKEVLEYAKTYYIDVQPVFHAFDSLKSILTPYPEYQLKGHESVPNIQNVEAKNYLKELSDELCDIFEETTQIYLGNYDSQLGFVREKDLKEDLYHDYINELSWYLSAKGKTVLMGSSSKEKDTLLPKIEFQPLKLWHQVLPKIFSSKSSFKIPIE